VAVAGDSAGGNLASAVALKARDQKIELAYQLLIYPCNDRNFETPSYIKNATGYGLSRQAMQWFWDQYLQGDSHDQNPYAIPARAVSFKNVAPAIIISAEYDPLLSDSEQYVELLKASGVDVRYREFKGMIHGFFTNLAVTPAAMDAIAFVAGEIKEITE
jgi:acetyl esterase